VADFKFMPVLDQSRHYRYHNWNNKKSVALLKMSVASQIHLPRFIFYPMLRLWSPNYIILSRYTYSMCKLCKKSRQIYYCPITTDY